MYIWYNYIRGNVTTFLPPFFTIGETTMVESIVTTMIILIISGFILWAIVDLMNDYVDRRIRDEAFNFPLVKEDQEETLKEIHGKLSWKGTNPFRVIALSTIIHNIKNEGEMTFDQLLALTSDYNGQTRKLIKNKQFLSAIIFFFRGLSCSKRARKLTVGREVTAEQLEVLFASYFALAQIPVIGRFWKETIVFKLSKALHLIDNKSKEERDSLAIMNAIISSRLFSITKKEEYKIRVKHAGLTRNMHDGQLNRIVRYLGMKDIPELYAFCEI